MSSEQGVGEQMEAGSEVVAAEIHVQRQTHSPAMAQKLVPGNSADDCSGEVCSGNDYDDVMTCLVCDRAFSTVRQLMHHQTRKHHFYCSICDSRFASLPTLKQHKESEDHWSECDEFLPDDSAADPRSGPEAGTQSCSEKERLL